MRNKIFLLLVMLCSCGLLAVETAPAAGVAETASDTEVSDSDVLVPVIEEPAAVQEPETAKSEPADDRKTQPAESLQSELIQREEFPEAFDFGGTLFTLDAQTAAQTRLFIDIQGFIEARIFRDTNNFLRVEILHKTDGRLSRIIKKVSETQLAEWKKAVSGILRDRVETLDESSPGLFIANSAFVGAGYGATYPFLAKKPSGETVLISMSVSTAIAAAVPPVLIYGMDIMPTRAQAHSLLHGAWRGYADGALLTMLIGGTGLEEPRAYLGTGLAISAAEMGLGIWLSKKMEFSGGDALMLANGSLFGYAIGASLYGLLISDEKLGDNGRVFPAFLLSSGVGGLFLGHLLTRYDKYTDADAALFNLSTFLMSAFPFSISFAAGSVEPRLFGALGLLGIAGGGAASFFILKNKDFTNLESFFISLGTGLGVGIAVGLQLAVGTNHNTGRYMLLTSTLGGMAGFAVTTAIFWNGAVRRALPEMKDVAIRFHPEAFIGMMSSEQEPKNSKKKAAPYGSSLQLFTSPVVEVEYRF